MRGKRLCKEAVNQRFVSLIMQNMRLTTGLNARKQKKVDSCNCVEMVLPALIFGPNRRIE